MHIYAWKQCRHTRTRATCSTHRKYLTYIPTPVVWGIYGETKGAPSQSLFVPAPPLPASKPPPPPSHLGDCFQDGLGSDVADHGDLTGSEGGQGRGGAWVPHGDRGRQHSGGKARHEGRDTRLKHTLYPITYKAGIEVNQPPSPSLQGRGDRRGRPVRQVWPAGRFSGQPRVSRSAGGLAAARAASTESTPKGKRAPARCYRAWG